MHDNMKNAKYFWIMNLTLVTILLGMAVQSELSRGVRSGFLLRLNEVSHYVSSELVSGAVEIPAGTDANAITANLPLGHRRRLLFPGDLPCIEFTVTASFDYTAQYDALKASPDVIPAIFIPGLGDSFEISLNGNVIASEWHESNGKISVHKWARTQAFPINPGFFERGENTLVYRIFGDPGTSDTGLIVSGNYVIDDFRLLNRPEHMQTVFAGIYSAVAATFFVFSLLYRQKKQNLWFALSALSMALYTFIRLDAFSSIISDYEWSFRFEALALFSFAYFATRLIYSSGGKEKLNPALRALTAIYVLCASAMFLPGRRFLFDVMAVYLIAASLILVYTFVFSLCVPLVRDATAQRKKGGSALKFLARALPGTFRGNMVISSSLPIVFALIDGITYIINSYQSIFLSRLGFLFFFLNMILALASEISDTYSRLVLYSDELRYKSAEVRQVEADKKQFVADVSREIRSAANEIIGAAGLALLKEGTPDSVKRALSQIGATGRSMLRALNNICGNSSDEYLNSAELYGKYFAGGRGIRAAELKAQSGGMHHFFIINPKSFVTKKDLQNFLLSVEKCFSVGRRAEYKVFVSRYPRDASATVHRYISSVPEDTIVRVYAVGGDGIAFDCLNGMMSFKNAELATIPYGNSNDICRSFGEENLHKFRDIKLMSRSPSREVDVIQCGSLYALSNCSIGIEAFAVKKFSSMIDLINGSFTRKFISLIYNLGAVAGLLDGSATGIEYSMTVDGEALSGDYLMINCSNMPHNGGKNTPSPFANPNDGMLNMITCRQCSVLSSLMIMPDYTNGRYPKHPKYFSHRRFKELHCESVKQFGVILDGETFYTNKINLKVIPSAAKIVSPDGIDFADYSHLAQGGSKR